MCSSAEQSTSPPDEGASTANNNNNNNAAIAIGGSSNSSAASSGNNGSQYALCALGVGLVALGVVMIVWSIVPGDAAGNSSSSGGGGGGAGGAGGANGRSKASSVAFVLVGSGVVMLLLSMCLGMRNKQREQQQLLRVASQQGPAAAAEQEEIESVEEQAQRYAVPSYEEVVGSGQYPVCQSNLRHSASQLPAYDDLVPVDRLQYEFEGGSEVPPPAPPQPAVAAASNRRTGKANRKLLPLKIRRIKSEKLHMKNADNSQPAAGFSIEPLTPPPQYEDKVAPL